MFFFKYIFSIYNVVLFHARLNSYSFLVLARSCLDLPPVPTFFHHGQIKLHTCWI